MTYSVTFNDSRGTQSEIGPFDSLNLAEEVALQLKIWLDFGSPANVTVNDLDS